MTHKNFDEKTPGYIDKTLNTLNTWFGGHATTTTPTQATQDKPSLPPPPPPKKSNTMLYVGIGVVAIASVTFYLIKKKK